MPETDDASTGGDSDLTDIVMSPSSKSMMDVSFESSSSTSPHQVPPLKRQKRVHFVSCNHFTGYCDPLACFAIVNNVGAAGIMVMDSSLKFLY